MGRWHGLEQAMQPGHRRNRTDQRFLQAEAGIARGDAQVALQGQLQAAAEAVAIDGGDQRLAQVEVGQVHQAHIEAGIGRRLFVEEQRLGIGRAGRPRALQVGADTEGSLATAGDDGHADFAAIADFRQVPAQGAQGLDVQGVQGIGAVEADQRHGATDFKLYGHDDLRRRWPTTGCARRRHRGSAR
ncbi:hypothetical protein D9M72_373840 [compost metagenome]